MASSFEVRLFRAAALAFLLAAAYPRAVGASETSYSTSVTAENPESAESSHDFYSYYTNIFYGPSLKGGSVYRPNSYGLRDRDNPIYMRNYLNAGYNLSPDLTMAANAYWIWQFAGKKFRVMDPYLQFGWNNYVNVGGFTMYGDVRVHFPVSQDSRDRDLIFGLQTFHIATYPIPDSRFELGTNLSAHYHGLGGRGYGDDLELFLAPNVLYRVSPELAAAITYQMNASHRFGQEAFHFNNDGTELQPGAIWTPTPKFYINPYFAVQTGGAIGLKTTTFGMYFNMQVI